MPSRLAEYTSGNPVLKKTLFIYRDASEACNWLWRKTAFRARVETSVGAGGRALSSEGSENAYERALLCRGSYATDA